MIAESLTPPRLYLPRQLKSRTLPIATKGSGLPQNSEVEARSTAVAFASMTDERRL